MTDLRARAATVALWALAAGCGTDDRPATWEYISPVILQPGCATVSCHSRASAVAGLDFSDRDRGYTSLMKLKVWVVDPSAAGAPGCKVKNGNVVCQRDSRPLVTPYNPEQSRLVNMLRARGADRMPPDRPLPEADIALIERWIRNGAAYHRGPPITITITDGGLLLDGGADAAAPDAGAPPDAAPEAGPTTSDGGGPG